MVRKFDIREIRFQRILQHCRNQRIENVSAERHLSIALNCLNFQNINTAVRHQIFADRFHCLVDGRKLRIAGLLAGGVLALAFLIGQYFVWRQLESLGYFVDSNPSNSFFYLITGLHGLHLAGGLIAWLRASFRLWRGADLARIRMSVELCTVYWHFLLLVWLVMFSLLLVT